MRGAARALAVLALGVGPAWAVDVTVTARPITGFMGAGLDEPVNAMIFRGGIAMVAQDDTFGGLSGVTPTDAGKGVSFVTDQGNFVAGQLAYDDLNRLIGFIGVTVEPMRNSSGNVLPRQFAKDAESVDTVYRDGVPVAVRVAFENLTRVADFGLIDGRPGGAAREIPIPDWLAAERSNEALESVCIAPPTSPVAGSTLLITEMVYDAAGNHQAYMLGNQDKGPLSLTRNGLVLNPTDCAFLPNGDLLVLERGVSIISFVMRVRRVPAAEVVPGAVMGGEVLLEGSGGSIDNMESIMVHAAPNGELRVLIGSDNNFNDWQRSLLLEFAFAP
jgi:hypothetical protein